MMWSLLTLALKPILCDHFRLFLSNFAQVLCLSRLYSALRICRPAVLLGAFRLNLPLGYCELMGDSMCSQLSYTLLSCAYSQIYPNLFGSVTFQWPSFQIQSKAHASLQNKLLPGMSLVALHDDTWAYDLLACWCWVLVALLRSALGSKSFIFISIKHHDWAILPIEELLFWCYDLLGPGSGVHCLR